MSYVWYVMQLLLIIADFNGRLLCGIQSLYFLRASFLLFCQVMRQCVARVRPEGCVRARQGRMCSIVWGRYSEHCKGCVDSERTAEKGLFNWKYFKRITKMTVHYNTTESHVYNKHHKFKHDKSRRRWRMIMTTQHLVVRRGAQAQATLDE